VNPKPHTTKVGGVPHWPLARPHSDDVTTASHWTVDASSALSRQSTAMVETEAMADGEKGGDAAATGCEP